MAGIGSVVSTIKTMADKEQTWTQKLAAILLLCISMRRAGTSDMDITTNIITDNGKAGINVGANPDGTPNLVNVFSYNVVKNIMNGIRSDGSVQCVIPANSLTITCTGANGGGPVTVTGTNILPITINGIFM